MAFGEAFKAFWQVLTGKDYSYTPELLETEEDVEEQSGQTLKISKNRETTSLKEAFNDGAVYTLVLLQREGRLIDFLKEDIDAFTDAQVGAAVRQIHRGTRSVLENNFEITAIFEKPEGNEVAIDADYDPSKITVIGELPETAPYNGLLQHKGWLAMKVELPERVGKVNTRVVYPAEVGFNNGVL